MSIYILLFFFGLFLLYLGAEFLVRGASKIALMGRISPLIVGVTVVAFGTSSPEIIVSFVAAFSNKPDVAVGNIVGSNIANIGLILGVSTFIRTVKLRKTNIKSHVFWMLGSAVVFWLLTFDSIIQKWEGMILFAALLVFIGISIRESLTTRIKSSEADEFESNKYIQKFSKPVQFLIYLILVGIGILILVWGSNVTIDSAVYIARAIGVSEIIIGLTLVAFGTSLPELATSILSIVRRENAILIGNVIGSNIFNILCVGGLVSSVIPLSIDNRVIIFDTPIMLFFSLSLLPVVYWWNRIPRIMGFILMAFYIVYILISFFYY